MHDTAQTTGLVECPEHADADEHDLTQNYVGFVRRVVGALILHT
jgi:hypothetical protein